ncbi:MAG TPA: hypothetical protein PLB41_06215 [Rubrivivax sp.]|nr:hypothetical protein [Rubrivivax sp.]HPO19222.1 hypothetical protein [Rubrivivax sp.]
MKLRQWLGLRRAAPQVDTLHDAAAAWVDAVCANAEAPPQDPPCGCGWFDSSHELHAGLQVTEHLSPERLANELPLGWWLDWQIAASPGAGPLALPCR